jgi:hypothetical protein
LRSRKKPCPDDGDNPIVVPSCRKNRLRDLPGEYDAGITGVAMKQINQQTHGFSMLADDTA